MKVCVARFICFLLLAVNAFSYSVRAANDSSVPVKAAMAEIDITPPVGYRLAGYFDERFSTGVHDPLKARALILDQGATRFALVFCDLVGPSLHVTTNARARASEATGIPVTNIVVAATHSHTGPLFDDIRRDFFHEAAVAKFGNDPHETIDYPAFLEDQLVAVISNANSALKPAELTLGITSQPGLPFNRRYYMNNGRVVFNPGQMNPGIVSPAGPIDSSVSMLLVKTPGSPQPIGGLTVFAMHADTIGTTEFSADYPFYIQETLREKFGSNFISAFGAGTCGDLNQIDVSNRDPYKGVEVSRKLGSTIGRTLLSHLPDFKPLSHASLANRSVTMQLPLQTASTAEISEARTNISRLGDPDADFYLKVRATRALDLSRNGPLYPMEVQVFRLDSDTAIVCLPAEIFVEFGLAIKQASPFHQTIVISICNDRPNYIPTRRAFSEGSYEVTNSRLMPGCGEAMGETAVKLLHELKP